MLRLTKTAAKNEHLIHHELFKKNATFSNIITNKSINTNTEIAWVNVV